MPSSTKPSVRTPFRALLIATVFAGSLHVQAPRAAGQDDAPPPVADLESRIADVDQRLEELRRLGDEAAGEVSRELDLLERLRFVLVERRRADERSAELDAEEKRLAEDTAKTLPERLGHAAPYSVAELDELLERAEALERSRVALAETAEASAKGFAAAEGDAAQAERRRRAAKEGLEAGGSPDEPRGLQRELEVFALEARVAKEEELLRSEVLENDRRALELARGREKLLGEASQRVWQEVEPTPEDERLAEATFEAEEKDVDSATRHARLELEQAESLWKQVQQQVASGGDIDAGLEARVDARRAELDTARERLDLLAGRRERLAMLREVWRLRLRLLRGEVSGQGDLSAAHRLLEDHLAELERARRRREGQVQEARASLLDLERRRAAAEGESAGRWLARELEADRGLAKLFEDDLARLQEQMAAVKRPLANAESRIEKVHLGERFAEVWEAFLGVWDHELFVVDDRPITVRKVFLALLLLVLGHLAARVLVRLLGRRVLRRFNLTEGAIAIFQMLAYYLLLLAFILWALKVVSIPLTIFTFLGGALAIGVGFGSQNIVNNFMSGLILMAERPVRVGDLIEIGGTRGRVERIGPRSTRIRSGENTHIIVPNSSLLESNVLNWTLSDNVIRTQVDVGVAYGSDTVETQRKLEEALAQCDRVLDSPKWEILFMDFGDNSLLFRALFWTQVRMPLDQRRAQSQVRFKIDQLFNEAGIVIAFPQRDVHLDLAEPLQVRLRDE